jgi:hypothetical protein
VQNTPHRGSLHSSPVHGLHRMVALSAAALVSPMALAQSVTITFVTASPTPISPWVVALMSVLTGAIAFVALRRAGAGRLGRLGAWLVAAVGAGAVLIGAPSGSLVQEVAALVPVQVVPLVTSPTVVSGVTSPVLLQATDNTSMPLIITAVSSSALGCLAIGSVGTTCNPGTTMQPAQSCNINIIPIC